MKQAEKKTDSPKAPEDAKVRVVTFPDKEKRKWTPQQWRRFWLWATFFPCVLVPVALAIIYFSFYAADRYVVQTKFTVRSPAGMAPTDVLGLMTGMTASGSTVLDSYIVSDFIESEQLIEKLQSRIDLAAIYDTDKADFLMRFDSRKPKEDFRRYLNWMISTYFDTSSQVVTVDVQAFDPELARLVSAEILALCQELVNEISEAARLDTVRTAEAEVARAEEKLRIHRKLIATFRVENQEIDPTLSAGSQQLLLGGIEEQIARSTTELAALQQFLDDDSPQIKILESEIRAQTAQLENQKARLSGNENDQTSVDLRSMTEKVGTFEELSVDLEFLQRAYVSALVSLETARLEADRQQRYMATFVHPSTPEKAVYPRRALNIVLVFLLSLMAWGIATMAVYIVREHAM